MRSFVGAGGPMLLGLAILTGCGSRSGSDPATELQGLQQRVGTSEASLATERADHGTLSKVEATSAALSGEVVKLQRQLVENESKRATEETGADRGTSPQPSDQKLAERVATLELEAIESEKTRATEMAALNDQTNKAQARLATSEYAQSLEDRIAGSRSLPKDDILPLQNARASSQDHADTGPSNVFDTHTYALRNCWLSGSGDVVGAWIELELKKESSVTGIRIWQGSDEDRIRIGGIPFARIKDAALDVGSDILQRFTVPDEPGWVYFPLTPVNTKRLRLFAESVHESQLGYIELCEVQIYGRG